MAKQDVIDAINATIVPNGSKAINADSLRNLLIMMTENAGEGGSSGSGDGALRVIVPEVLVIGLMIANVGELSPSSWTTMRAELEAELGGFDLSEYETVVNASFVHNADVLQQILAKARAGQGVSIVLDQTPYCPAATNALIATTPEYATAIEEAFFSCAQPAGFTMEYMKPTPEGDEFMGGEQHSCRLVPTGGVFTESLGFVNYPSNVIITLNSDGSLLFDEIESETESGS